jgi:hypothetical protein
MATGKDDLSGNMRLPPARSVLAVLAALALAAPAYPWGVEGHKAIALEATQALTPGARAHVVKILGSDDLASIAVWMDELRSVPYHAGPLADDPDAQHFSHLFPKNGTWHYIDLPLGTQAYTLDVAFSKPDDVVHMLEAAVAVLEGGGDARITRREALCMVVHFVGDLHQPLHCANGYFTVSDGKAILVTDPVAAKDADNDKGGNTDFFGPGKYDELHAYWDSDLVWKQVGGARDDPAAVAAVIEKKTAADGAAWKSAGDYHHWPEAWATESIEAARVAYAGIVFGTETPDMKGGIKRIDITLPPGYDDMCIPLAAKRLAQGGYHLGELLNAIKWAD